MHWRGPAPKGRYTNFGRAALRSGVNHHERDDEDEPPARQVIAANLVWSHGLARETPRRRVQPQGFLNHHAGVRKAAEIVVCGKTAAKNGVDLVLEASLGLGML